jgi:hypothetical protein
MLAALAENPQQSCDPSKVSEGNNRVEAVRLIGKASRHSHRPEGHAG